MKTRIMLLGLLAAALSLVSCSQDDVTANSRNDAQGKHATIRVVRTNMAPDMGTRALQDSISMEFVKDDAIGIYEIDGSGNVTKANYKFVYDGYSSWHQVTGDIMTFDDQKTYMAYYPYKSDDALSSICGANPVVSPGNTTNAAGFFTNLIAQWQPNNDQSTRELYDQSDLMVAKGTDIADGGLSITFNMEHQMTLLLIHTDKVKYVVDKSYYWYEDVLADCKGDYLPLREVTANKRTLLRYIQQPDTRHTITARDDTWSVTQGVNQRGYYRYINVAWTSTYTPQIGDFYYNDGSLSHTIKETSSYVPVGIVAYLKSDRYTSDDYAVNKGFTELGQQNGYQHGLVMSLDIVSLSSTTSQYYVGNDYYPGKLVEQTYNNNAAYLTHANFDFDKFYEIAHSDSETNPAYKAVYDRGLHPDRQSVGVPNSGWFVPTAGQMAIALIGFEKFNKNDSNSPYKLTYNGNWLAYQNTGSAVTSIGAANVVLSLATTGVKHPFVSNEWYLTCTYTDNHTCVFWNSVVGQSVTLQPQAKNDASVVRIRPLLAF